MKVTPTAIPDVLVIEPRLFRDSRGHFFESFNQRDFDAATGGRYTFVQDNESRSGRNVLRGLHYQIRAPQGKLVRVLRGTVFDVAVDLRRSSATFGRWTGVELSAKNRKQLWIPPGFAHGFLVLNESADSLYKVTGYHAPQHERCIRWDDPTLAIAWPLQGAPVLSERDARAPGFSAAETYA
jgi:dTDP-4-dehydrorhamnose 3,5-epimerase